ncbi:hypothetical protein PGT21_020025 [Puccinia graminis f. sp. tritici]|uniref:C2 domain-containing protein n=1 Tax=Puccinia graminis f. sp. tritici TaxID=56615 RepID=A0A5B0PW19_PUCGR|nr:hypothetical protein PGT21_020025 [Puccinia graminis f. sp. tritici]
MSVKQFDYAINHQQQKKSSLDTQPQTSTILQSDPDHLHHPNHSDSLKSITKKLDNTRAQSSLDPIKTDIDKPSAITQEITSAILTDGTNPEELPLLDHTAGQDNLNQLLESIPGQLNESPLTNKIPDWYKIGWAAQIEHVDLSSKSDQDEAKHLDLIETFLSEVYYGTWFHNAAVIFFAVAASHYITLFGGGWASLMYDPNVFTLNLEQMLAGALVDSAVGVLQIAIASAQGLKAVKIGGGTPDPYVTFSIGARLNLDRTKVKHSTQSPNWKSVHFLLIHSLNEILTMEIMDYNEVRKDTSLGTASVDLQTLVTEPEQEGLMVPIMYQGKPRGEIRLSMVYHPCLVPKQLENGETEPVPETSAGVTRLVLHQAKELDYKRTGTSNLSPYAKIYLNGKEILKTPVIKRTNNPVYEAFTEVLISSKPDAVFTINMFDDRHGDDPKIGSVNVKLPDLLELTSGEQKLDWFPLVGAKSGKLRISAIWKGIMMAGAINGASAYTPPIGILRFHFDRAEDLKNVEALTGGKSDPYVRVMRSGIVLSRSQIHNNDLDPVFDEIIYVPVHR